MSSESAYASRYGRWLSRATRWGFDAARLRQHLRTAFAACLALIAAWQLGLDHPQWAAMTVWAASQPLRGQLLEKSFFRVAGTVVGTAVGVGLVLLAQGNLAWLITGLAIWLGLCAGIGNLQRSFVSYGTMLSGYSAAMVALLDTGRQGDVFALGWDRLFTALTGVFAALLVGWLFTPKGSGIPGNAELRQLCARLLRDLADGLQARGRSSLGSQELARRLLAMSAMEDGLDAHGAGSMRSREAVRSMRRLMNAQISALLWLRDAPSLPEPKGLNQADAEQAAQALREAALLLETQAQPHEAVTRLAEARQALTGWHAAAEVLTPLTLSLQAHIAAAGNTPLPAAHGARQWPVVLHSDWLGARRAMLRAALSIVIAGMFWIATGWEGGAYMLLGLSIMLTVFSSFENPAATMRHVVIGQALGVLVALACQWLVWPFVHGPASQVLSMLPFIYLGALLFSHRRTMLSGYDCCMVLLLLLYPLQVQDSGFAHSLALGLAVVAGPLAGWAAYRFILPVTLKGRLQALHSMMVHDLQDMAATQLHARDARAWRARLYHRLISLVRLTEQAGGQHSSQAAESGIATLHLGRAIQSLHELAHDRHLPEGTQRARRAALLRLQQLQARPEASARLLQALALRLAANHAPEARLLDKAARELRQHLDFFAGSI
ncbi:FUSC family protein [Comamonas composti]|uniref:FUSC family protein n=1 Tax=Comamonas composti TaxID=408558 RepID=UPI00040454B7|nr:FUSC family protein [Comamonas composti]